MYFQDILSFRIINLVMFQLGYFYPDWKTFIIVLTYFKNLQNEKENKYRGHSESTPLGKGVGGWQKKLQNIAVFRAPLEPVYRFGRPNNEPRNRAVLYPKVFLSNI